MTIVVNTPAGAGFASLVAFLAEKRMEFAVTNNATNSVSRLTNLSNILVSANKMSKMTIVVKTPAGPAFTSLVAFLAEKIMEFAVTNDATMEDSDASNAHSDEVRRMASGRVKREEPEFDAPPNMEQFARNNKRNQAARDLSQASGVRPNFLAKRTRQEEPALGEPTGQAPKPVAQTITPNEDSNDSSQDSHETNNETALEQQSPRKIVCKICKKTMARNWISYLRSHALRHSGLKTWKCTICNKTFTRAQVAQLHFEAMHPEVPFVPFVNTRTEKDEEHLRQVMEKCFPSAQK
ncbi:hypothetical protein B9Z55_007221 [Caenorhabditis nigoni]|nr:hypothetical protein B9Z55_007221 [Caenorhabditis nigoni]